VLFLASSVVVWNMDAFFCWVCSLVPTSQCHHIEFVAESLVN